MGFAMVGKTLWTLRGVKREGDDQGLPEGRGDIPIPLALGIWAVSTLGFVALVWYLVPEFPWWISAFFGFVWTPIYSYIGARMIGPDRFAARGVLPPIYAKAPFTCRAIRARPCGSRRSRSSSGATKPRPSSN